MASLNPSNSLVVVPVGDSCRTLEIAVAVADPGSHHSRPAAAVVLAQSPSEIGSELGHHKWAAVVGALARNPAVVAHILVAVAERALKTVPLAAAGIEAVVVAHIAAVRTTGLVADTATVFAVTDSLAIVAVVAQVSTAVGPTSEPTAGLVDTSWSPG